MATPVPMTNHQPPTTAHSSCWAYIRDIRHILFMSRLVEHGGLLYPDLLRRQYCFRRQGLCGGLIPLAWGELASSVDAGMVRPLYVVTRGS